MSADNLSKEAKSAVAVLRALVISRKPPAYLREILRDYREIEGRSLPVEKFGFKKIEDFLRASGEFLLINIHGELCLSAAPSHETNHIVKMISKQKAPKKRSGGKLSRMPKMSDHSWNRSSYSNFYRNVPILRGNTVKRSFQNNNIKVSINQIPVRYNNPIDIKVRTIGDSNNNTNNTNLNSSQKISSLMDVKKQPVTDLRALLDAKRQQTVRPILGQNGNENLKIMNNRQEKVSEFLDKKMQSTNDENAHKNQLNSQKQIEIPNKNTNNGVKNPPLTINLKCSTIQNRLKISTNLTSVVTPPPESTLTPPNTPLTPPQKIKTPPPLVSQNICENSVINKMPKVYNELPITLPLTDIQALDQYCLSKKFPLPHYEFFRAKIGGRKYQCRVTVNDISYSTYPDEFTTEIAAKEACAKIAMENVKVLQCKLLVPLCMDSDYDLAMKIHRELKANFTSGIFVKNFPDVFEKIFNQSLPDHWFSIVQNTHYFILEETADGNFILFAKTESSESSSAASSVVSDFEEENSQISLPWESKYWNIFITSCVSTVEIWGRLIGAKYSEKLNALITDIEMAMLTDKKRPVSIIDGSIYLVCIDECWQRVRIDKIEKANGKCLCVFIDFGDEEWLSMDQLYVCESKFIELPAQAIPFSLFGLEDFAENPIAKRQIDSMLEGKSLIAEIVTKNDSNERVGAIQVVLYDTSSNEDVNLNPILLKKICDDTKPPELKRTEVTNVNITHITESGEVYMQARTLGLVYVENLINRLVQCKFKEDQHKVISDDLNTSKIFLIKDIDDNRWYRGCLVNNSNVNSDRFDIFYVDSGKIKNIHKSHIFKLESLSTALSKYPAQAIKTKLYNLPRMNNNIVARIKGLLRLGYPAIVKLAAPDSTKVPEVVVFVRVNRNNTLCNVNESIRMEHELESTLQQEEHKSLSPVLNSSSDITEFRNLSCHSPKPLQVDPTINMNKLEISSSSVIPAIGELFNILVTISSNPYNFLIQSYNDFPAYQEMFLNLQEFCRKNSTLPTEIFVGEHYAALRKSDGKFYRARVERKFPSGTSCVYFIDCGDSNVVENSDFKPLPDKFRKVPKQAIHAKLYGVKPINGEWTTEDSIRFRELTLDMKFASYIKDVTIDNFHPDKPKVLELDLIDVSTDYDIFIRNILIDEKRAVPA